MATVKMIAEHIALGDEAQAQTLLGSLDEMQIDEPEVHIMRELHRATLLERNGRIDDATASLRMAVHEATERGMRSLAAEAHKRLRDLALTRSDLPGYVEHNNEFTRITEAIQGKEATQRLAMIEAERKMEAERRERDKERAVLYSTLPKHVADRVVRGEQVSGDLFDDAAVMFADIVGFTSHTSTMAAVDVVALLEHIFSAFDGACERHSVTKVKTIGDSYMCFRGDADAPTNARSVATLALDVMQLQFQWPDGSPVQFRVGIHIGPATAGIIGTQRLQYDVWGDTVNVASRMESSGEPGRVHVTEAFASELKRNTEYTIQNSIIESGNPESHEVSHEVSHNVSHSVSHEVPLVTRHSSLVTIERGEIDLKGKGLMNTYWLEGE
ncbi:MAG: hypothetical protein JSS89_05215 [Bacteroidetes bacterium]|nr:hypothetical protein [Bacteroidota bacterium]